MIADPPSVSSSPALTDEETLNTALDWVATQMPLETQGVYSPQTVYHVLLWAAHSQGTSAPPWDSIPGVCGVSAEGCFVSIAHSIVL